MTGPVNDNGRRSAGLAGAGLSDGGDGLPDGEAGRQEAAAFPGVFPGPWTIREQGRTLRIVDARGRVACYIYYDDAAMRWRRSDQPTREQALALARRLVRLPGLLQEE